MASWASVFYAICQVAGISQTGHNIGMGIDLRIDCANPESGVGREMRFYIIDTQLRSDDRSDVYFAGVPFERSAL